MLVVEHDFELPKGYVDAGGTLHRKGAMRLATAADEILPMKDPRVQGLPAYLIIILLSRVVVRLGTVAVINPAVIEGLFAEDLAFLQQMYNRINGLAPPRTLRCPHCDRTFRDEDGGAGGVFGYPLNRVYEEVAVLGRHVHWTLGELLGLDHAERRRWLVEVTRGEETR